ncbi:MAG: hypothetical protein ACR2NJ_03660 [Acidimicrobiales bacterium]
MSVWTSVAGSCYIVIGLLAAMFVAWRVSGRVVEQSDAFSAHLVVALVVGLTQLIGVELLCGAVVLLHAPVVLAVHVAIAAAVWRKVPPAARLGDAPGRVSAPVAALGGVLAFAAITAGLLSARGVPTDSDDIGYHLPNAASWLRVHDLWHLPPADPGYFTNAYPSDGELLTSWVMQPFHGGQLASWPTLLFGLLLLASAAMIGEQLIRSASAGLLGGATIVLAPFSWQTQVHSALTDWASASGLIAAVAFVLRGRADPRLRWPLLAGLALGIGIGSKDTGLLPGACVVVFALIVLPRAVRWRAVPVIGAGIVALAGLWFVRTGIQTGNPIYPEPVRIGGTTVLTGGVSPLTQYSTSLATDIVTVKLHGLRVWTHLVRTLVGPPIVVCAGVVLAFWRFRQRTHLALCGALAVLFFGAYLATPYTGPQGQAYLIASQLRYALAALVLAAICACAASVWMQLVAWAAVVADIVSIVHGSSFNPDVDASKPILAAGALVGIVVAGVLWQTDWLTWVRPVARPGAVPRPGARPAVQPIAVIGMTTVVLVGAGALLAVRHSPNTTALDQVLAASANAASSNGDRAASARTARGPVMIIGDTNIFLTLGAKLNHHLIGAGTGAAGEVPINSATGLDRAVRAARPVAIVVGPVGQPGVIPGWSPAGYHLAGTTGGNRVYLTLPPVTVPATPPTTLPVSPPSTTIPPVTVAAPTVPGPPAVATP